MIKIRTVEQEKGEQRPPLNFLLSTFYFLGRRPQGFSLIELLLAVAVLGIIGASVTFMFIGGLRAWNVEEAHSELLHNNQNVLSQVCEALMGSREIAAAGPRRLVFAREFGQAAGTQLGVIVLRPGEGSWEPLNGQAPGAIPAGTTVFDLVRLSDTTLLAAGGDGYVYRSADAGGTWSAAKLGDATEVRAIAAIDDMTIYAATAENGDVYKSTDGGLTWVNTGELTGASAVRALAGAPDGRVWAGTDWTGDSNVFATTDGGATWTGVPTFTLPPGTWAYRKPVQITNSSAGNLLDYQVRIPVGIEAGKMKSDFSDLRFRDAGGTDLPFWIEACDSGVSAIAWVKVPQINAVSSVTIYMYYGNATAASASDIAATMDAAYTRYDVPYNWTPKVSTTSIANGDDIGAWVSLSYEFPYWREFQNQIYTCSNGYLSFGSTYGDDDKPRADRFHDRSMIAAFWEDLRTDMTYGTITEPGVFVDSYQDHTVLTYQAVSFRQWRAGPVRYRAELIFQVLTYRNGDVKVSYQLIRNAANMNPIAGLSKGDGTNFVETTTDVAQDKTFLFGIRQYVAPEPTAAFGPEEVVATVNVDVLTLCVAGGVLYAGTSDGAVLRSADGGMSWDATAPLPGANFVHRLFTDNAGILFVGTEPGGAVYRSSDGGTSWTPCAPLPGADQTRAIDETLRKRLICGVCPTGSVQTSTDSGATWSALPAPAGVTAVYCLRPVLERVEFSWSGNKYQDTGDRGDMVLRTVAGSTATIDNGYTSNLLFEYLKSDMSPADTSTPQGRAWIATVRVTVESSSGGSFISDRVSITLRNR